MVDINVPAINMVMNIQHTHHNTTIHDHNCNRSHMDIDNYVNDAQTNQTRSALSTECANIINDNEMMISSEPIQSNNSMKISTDTNDVVQPSVRSYSSLRSFFSKSPPLDCNALPPVHTPNATASNTCADKESIHINTMTSNESSPLNTVISTINKSDPNHTTKSLSNTPRPISFFTSLFSTSDEPSAHSTSTPTSASQSNDTALPIFNRTSSTPHSAPANTRTRSNRSASAADSVHSVNSGVIDSAIAWLRKKSNSNADIDEIDEIKAERQLIDQQYRERQERLKLQAKLIKQSEQLRKQWNIAFDNFHDYKQSSKQLQQLCWPGIPTSFRTRAWIEIVGNALNITPELYSILLARARELRHTVQSYQHTDTYITSAERRASRSEEQYQKEESLRAIDKDIPRTFPELKFLHSNPGNTSPITSDDMVDDMSDGELHGGLHEILQCFVCYRPDVGMCINSVFSQILLSLNWALH